MIVSKCLLSVDGRDAVTDSLSSYTRRAAIFTTHIEKDIDQERVVTLLQGFRNYLHYHIKASKSYMQSRMRTRVSMLLESKFCGGGMWLSCV